MPSFYDDHDLARERAEDRRRDEPDPRELERMQAASDAWLREIAAKAIGSQIVRKAA